MSQPTTKKEEALAERSQIAQEQNAPPSYSPETSQPPTYDSLSSATIADMALLASGDPSETISVPMITRVHHKTIHDYNPFSRKTGQVTQSVTVRKMTRGMYLKHYIKDAEGNFIGSGNPAPDAGLVFVPGKSTPEDVMRQVQEVAFGKQSLRGGGIGTFGRPQDDGKDRGRNSMMMGAGAGM
ncbi:hypothetical protein GQ44DRAFT_713874 [Phaeosphaeriaceae sp. PMI808]|nr:hypothetical protein GQ44DRAFT_713874 [Phaeosphaeriaceae sp. PMI808]